MPQTPMVFSQMPLEVRILYPCCLRSVSNVELKKRFCELERGIFLYLVVNPNIPFTTNKIREFAVVLLLNKRDRQPYPLRRANSLSNALVANERADAITHNV